VFLRTGGFLETSRFLGGTPFLRFKTSRFGCFEKGSFYNGRSF
jgi:hypothetical protein